MGNRNRKKIREQYDYENAFDKRLEDLDSLFVEEMMKNKVGLHYVTKTIKSGKILEIEIYPAFKGRNDIPKVTLKNKLQNDLNEKNSRKRFIRLVNENFGEGDLWLTLTYEDNFHPKTEEEAKRNISNYLKRVNRLRKKRGLKNAKYIYIMEWEETRCHYHIPMEGGIERDKLEDMWKFAVINNTSRIHPNEEGITGLAAYMADKKRKKGKRRWTSSKNLKQPKESVNHRKTGKRQVEKMVRDYEEIRTFFEKDKKWSENHQFVDAEVFYNKFNCAYYIRIKARERRWKKDERKKRESDTGHSNNHMYHDYDVGGMGGHTTAKRLQADTGNNTGRENHERTAGEDGRKNTVHSDIHYL